MVKLNINDRVRVTLTSAGLTKLWDHYNNYGMKPLESELRGMEYTSQLWNLFRIFGSEMFMGNTKQMFESNEVIIL